MASLRDRWHRTRLWSFFAAMEAADRATALIVLTLALATVLCFSAIARDHARSLAATASVLG